MMQDILAVYTGDDASEMVQILGMMASLAMKLARGEELGPASVEGYVPRGIRRQVIHDKLGYERAVDTLLNRMAGRPYQSEMLITGYDDVSPAQPLTDLESAAIGLVSSGGFVPRGNQDRLVGSRAETLFKYDISQVAALPVEDWESVHGGFGILILNTKGPELRHAVKHGSLS